MGWVYGNSRDTASRPSLGATKLRREPMLSMIRQPRERGRMRRIRLDRIDRGILRNLVTDGRMTNVELAPEVLGYAVTVFAQVGLSSQADSDLKAFERLVATWPEVREAYMLAGETDFLLKIVAPDWDSYQRFLTAKLTSAPNVSHVKSA